MLCGVLVSSVCVKGSAEKSVVESAIWSDVGSALMCVMWSACVKCLCQWEKEHYGECYLK